MFTEGRDYTRDEIHAQIGGSTETYLPHRDGRILCACLDPDLNPDAPNIIIPGTGPMIEKYADILRRRTGALPVFIKRERGAWRYVGDFEVEPRRYNAADIEAQRKRSGRTDITSVIWLRPALPLHPARSLAEVIAAARRFGAEVRGTTALRRIFRTTRTWVPTGEGTWAPATWAAYGDAAMDPYVAAMQGKFKLTFTLDEATAIKIIEGLGFVFAADPPASAALATWAGTLEPQVLDGIEPRSLKFATPGAVTADDHDPEPDDDDGDVDDGAAGPRTFGLLVNPARYDVVGASAVLDEDTWLLPAGEARVGDRLAFWRTTHGKDRRRGVVVFAEVIGEAKLRPKGADGLRFWLEEPPADPQRRIEVRYIDAPNLPLWLEDDHTGTLAALSVGRGQGTKLYKITLEQWAALVTLAGGWNPRDEGAPTTPTAPPPSAPPAATVPPAVQLVLTRARIAQSIASFNSDARANADLVRNILRTTSLWVYDSDTDTFGPNKFVGWHPITFALYEQGRQDQRVGGSPFDDNVTRVAIEAALGRSYAARPEAHAALARWAEAIGGAGVLDVRTTEQWEFVALDQWPDEVEDQRVAEAVTEAAEEIVERRRGQGYSSDPAVRRAVELHAMDVAKAYLIGLGRNPKNTSATRPYDFECEGASDHRFVEVKGTMGDGSEVLLTVNEVEHARAHPGVSSLVVVHGIKAETAPDGTIITSGGTMRLISPWSPDDSLLRPLTFRYTLPGGSRR